MDATSPCPFGCLSSMHHVTNQLLTFVCGADNRSAPSPLQTVNSALLSNYKHTCYILKCNKTITYLIKNH